MSGRYVRVSRAYREHENYPLAAITRSTRPNSINIYYTRIYIHVHVPTACREEKSRWPI